MLLELFIKYDLLGLYLQHFIFFVACKQTQQARAFVACMPLQLSVKHFSLLVPFVSYKENEVLLKEADLD
jgi:hypothetical protein